MATDDGNTLAQLFGKITHGVYVIGVAHGERRSAFTAAWLMQVSYDPLLLALSVNPANATYALMREAGTFTVNVLKQGQDKLARHFGTRSTREFDKLDCVIWRPGQDGAPVLERSLAYFECRLVDELRAGDHALCVGRVLGGRILDSSGTPMNYAETGTMDGSAALYPSAF